MKTIADGLYLHHAGPTLIISDQKVRPRQLYIRGKLLLAADDMTALKRRFRTWLEAHTLDEIAHDLAISRSAAHRLRAALAITKRDSYSKPG